MDKDKVDKEWSQGNHVVQTLSNEELGALVKEYYAESNHSNWEGFNSHDKTGIRRMFSDMYLFQQNR